MTPEERELVLRVGKAQVTALLQQQDHSPIDDSEFIPLLEVVLTAFETVGVAKVVVEELWEYAFDLYDQMCKDTDPESTTAENRRLMQSYLRGSRRRRG